MKTLKMRVRKALSIMLTAVMVIGMFPVSIGAQVKTLTEEDEIVYDISGDAVTDTEIMENISGDAVTGTETMDNISDDAATGTETMEYEPTQVVVDDETDAGIDPDMDNLEVAEVKD